MDDPAHNAPNGAMHSTQQLRTLSTSSVAAMELRHPDAALANEEMQRNYEPSVQGGSRLRKWLSPRFAWAWVLSWVLPGLGMFTESYYIFSTGQIKSIWRVAYPECWQPNKKAFCPANIECRGNFKNTPANLGDTGSNMCDSNGFYKTGYMCANSLIDAVSYIEFAGIMTGMLTLGFVAVRLGLKWTSVCTISIMGIGAVLMTASDGRDYKQTFIMFAAAYCIFGLGVGGEYPTAAVGAAERYREEQVIAKKEAEAGGKPTRAGGLHRGRAVQMVFSLQGWGAVIGAAIICIVLAGFDARRPICASNNNPQGYNEHDLAATWRILYGLGLLPIIYTLYFRVFRVHEPKDRRERMEQIKQARMNDPDYVPFGRRLFLFMYYYWSRLAGTALAWFVWDVAFYGNKLFTGPIFSELLGPGSHLLDTNLYILLNNVVALVGYWFAAYTIDKIWMGRVRLQMLGFIASGALFLACGIAWHTLNVHVRLFLYIFTSFWGQFGPNATTWIMPSESFPSEVRTIGHGISAFAGKGGALLATAIFVGINTRTIFIVCGACCLAGAVITLVLTANLTTLDLVHQEEQWDYIQKGRFREYHGDAVKPSHLSLFERLLGYGRLYRGDEHAHVISPEGKPGHVNGKAGYGDAPVNGKAGYGRSAGDVALADQNGMR